MQVQGIVKSSYLAGGYDEEQSRHAEEQTAGNRFTARKTAMELRYGPFSFTLSRSSLQGATPENSDETLQSQSSPARSRKVNDSDGTDSYSREYQRLAMGALMESVQGLSKQVEELQRTLSTMREGSGGVEATQASPRLVSDPSVLLSASFNGDEGPVEPAFPFPSSIIAGYSQPASVPSTVGFHAIA